METKNVIHGFAIVVCDRGYVYVGDCTIDESFCVIEHAKNIRKWGTTKGLGELTNGPLRNTVLDDFGSVSVPMHAVISIIDADGSKWNA
jgi:hypothetical protein